MPLFSAFLLQLSEGEHHTNGGLTGWLRNHIATLGRPSLRQNLEPLQRCSGEQLPYDAKEGDATVVISVAPIAFVLVQCDDVCIPHVLWYLTFSLAETKDFVQLRDDVSFVALQDFSRNAFLTRCFARGKGVETQV